LRSIPGLTVIRPADPNETAEAWAFAVEHEGPTLLALTRQGVAHLDRSRSSSPGVAKGAYILSEAEGGPPEVILIATGSEVQLCVKAQASLKESGVRARVVSMPSWEIFSAQDAAYREAVLPKAIRKRLTIEAAATFGWHRWAGDEGVVIGIDRFGASAPGEEIFKQFGFTAERVTSEALRLLGKTAELVKG
jgi:transketolase